MISTVQDLNATNKSLKRLLTVSITFFVLLVTYIAVLGPTFHSSNRVNLTKSKEFLERTNRRLNPLDGLRPREQYDLRCQVWVASIGPQEYAFVYNFLQGCIEDNPTALGMPCICISMDLSFVEVPDDFVRAVPFDVQNPYFFPDATSSVPILTPGPTTTPSSSPSSQPSHAPTSSSGPSSQPSHAPTSSPSPSSQPSQAPVKSKTSLAPTLATAVSSSPSPAPSSFPSSGPSPAPTLSSEPTVSSSPTTAASSSPSDQPSLSSSPSTAPTLSSEPTASASPTVTSSASPSSQPSEALVKSNNLDSTDGNKSLEEVNSSESSSSPPPLAAGATFYQFVLMIMGLMIMSNNFL